MSLRHLWNRLQRYDGPEEVPPLLEEVLLLAARYGAESVAQDVWAKYGCAGSEPRDDCSPVAQEKLDRQVVRQVLRYMPTIAEEKEWAKAAAEV